MNAARKNNKCARNKLCSAQKFIPHPREHIRRRRFFSQCAYKYLSVPIYTLPRAKTYYVAQNYLLHAPKNIRCADLFSKCAETFVIVCEGTKPASRAYLIDPSRHRATPAGCAVNCLACQRCVHLASISVMVAASFESSHWTLGVLLYVPQVSVL